MSLLLVELTANHAKNLHKNKAMLTSKSKSSK
jgi:hypothetical protein